MSWHIRCCYIINLCLFVMVSCCNEKHNIARQYRKFISHEINIPNEMTLFDHGVAKVVNTNTDFPIYVIYYGPQECTSCNINAIRENEPIFELSEEYGSFVPMIIFSPKRDNIEIVRNYLVDTSIVSLPVFLDDSLIMHSNQIPDDLRFHHFLLSPNRHPVFVGNIGNNYDMERLFFDTLNQL